MELIAFVIIRKRAEDRKGGKAALEKLLADHSEHLDSEAITDDRVLSAMARYIFASGISRKVVDNKWPGIEDAFRGFDPSFLNLQPDDFWHDLLDDKRIIRHGAKVNAIRANAAFLSALAAEHGSAAKFLLDWPATDQIGLMDLLVKRGDRLGGMTGQYLLRAIGKDSFALSRDVLACLKDAGVPITGDGSTKSERRAIQEAFNSWQVQTGLPMTWLSRICAYSIDTH